MALRGLEKHLHSQRRSVLQENGQRTGEQQQSLMDTHRPRGGTHSPSRLYWPDPRPSGPGRCPPSGLDPHLKNTHKNIRMLRTPHTCLVG